MDKLQSSWSRCWQGLGATGDGLPLQARLVAAYGEPQRHYHTLQHLSECLGTLEPLLDLAEHPAEVEIALWFHDAVYDVQGKDNEARSAAWAAKELAAAGVAQASVDRVVLLIMATCHAALPEGPDQQLLVDVDLAILGAPRPRFIEYETQVRDEYGWVPALLFRRRRRAVLQAFLDRETLYNTPALRERLEAQARANLRWSLQQLGG